MSLRLITAPTVEPLSLTEAKSHLRVDSSDEDTLITAVIQAAREAVETMTRRALITQTWEYRLDEWWEEDYLEIPLPPLQSVVSLKYVDEDGNESSLTEGTDFSIDIKSEPGRLWLLDSAPTTTLLDYGGIRIQYTCGYGDAGSDVPEPIRQAMRLLVGHYYENREAVLAVPGANATILPQAVDALLAGYRIWSF